MYQTIEMRFEAHWRVQIYSFGVNFHKLRLNEITKKKSDFSSYQHKRRSDFEKLIAYLCNVLNVLKTFLTLSFFFLLLKILTSEISVKFFFLVFFFHFFISSFQPFLFRKFFSVYSFIKFGTAICVASAWHRKIFHFFISIA